MSDQFGSTEITSDDKLWAALGYPFFPIAIIMLFMEDKKNRPFIKFHAIQSIVINAIIIVLSMITIGCFSVAWLVTLWPAYDSYQGNYTEIPIVTNFIKKQGWV